MDECEHDFRRIRYDWADVKDARYCPRCRGMGDWPDDDNPNPPLYRVVRSTGDK